MLPKAVDYCAVVCGGGGINVVVVVGYLKLGNILLLCVVR